MAERIKINSYVRLRKGFDETDMYRDVEAGATGWVKDKKKEDGFNMIFVKWDENNPHYAGEQDKWTFANHFEVMSNEDNSKYSASKYVEAIKIATDAALIGTGFILIAVKKTKDNRDVDIYEPLIFGGELNKESTFILEAQVAHMASTLFDEYVQETLNMIVEDGEDESGR
jgi:hypothetical protein